MERLTIYLYDVNDDRHYGIANYDAKNQDIINLLGIYEDFGLTPEEISALQEKYSLEVQEVSARCDMVCCINNELTNEITSIKAQLDSAIEEIKLLAGSRGMPGICSTCKHQHESSLGDHCVKCDGKNKRGYEWHGLEEIR